MRRYIVWPSALKSEKVKPSPKGAVMGRTLTATIGELAIAKQMARAERQDYLVDYWLRHRHTSQRDRAEVAR